MNKTGRVWGQCVLLHSFFISITLCESPFIVLVKTNLPFFRTRKCNSWAKKIKSELVWSGFLRNFEVMGDLIPIIEGPAKIRDGKKVRNIKILNKRCRNLWGPGTLILILINNLFWISYRYYHKNCPKIYCLIILLICRYSCPF